jgi:hypothetical protein
MTTVRIKIPNLLDRVFTWPVTLYRRLKKGAAYRRIYLGENIWTLVSPSDYHKLSNYNWYIAGNGKNFYAFRNIKLAPGKSKMQGIHRMIMHDQLSIKNSKFKTKLVVDHINNDPLDNRRSNLRLATHAQNARNRKIDKSKTSSRYVGVYFEKATGRWTSKIRIKGKRLWLGRFDKEIDAAKAYDAAAKKYHGEFAKLNFPKEI